MSGVPRDSGLAATLRDVERRLVALERGSNRSLTRTESKTASGPHAMFADDAWILSPEAQVRFPIPRGFSHVTAMVMGQADNYLNGTGNSMIGSGVGLRFLDADDQIVDSEGETVDSAEGYTPFHPSGSRASASSGGHITREIPEGAVTVWVYSLYRLYVSGQTQDPGAASTFVSCTCEFRKFR